jgi:hypothetical protein
VGESGTPQVCPYCEGKGYISVPVDLPPADPGKEPSRTTWVRKPCPLCGGKGSISGTDAATPNVPRNGHPNSFVSSADISADTRRFGSFRPSDCFQVVLAQARESWPRICGTNKMRRILSGEIIEQLEKLVSELRAIRHWDNEYRRNRFPEYYEKVAFVSRRERRSEIIRQLLRLAR